MLILLCIICALQFIFIARALGKKAEAQSSPQSGGQADPDGEKEAFALLMGYNADIAYGVKRLTED